MDLGSSLDAEEQTTMHDALHYVLTTVAASGDWLYQSSRVSGISQIQQDQANHRSHESSFLKGQADNEVAVAAHR